MDNCVCGMWIPSVTRYLIAGFSPQSICMGYLFITLRHRHFFIPYPLLHLLKFITIKIECFINKIKYYLSHLGLHICFSTNIV